MTSYELLDFYEKMLSKIEELNIYTDEVFRLIKGINVHKDTMLNIIYGRGISRDTGDLFQTMNSERDSILTIMGKFAMEFDTLENYKKLIRVKDEAEALTKECPSCLSEEKSKIMSLLDKYTNMTSTIYDYVKSKNNDIVVKLLNECAEVANEYDKIIESYKIIKDFMAKSENSIEIKDNEKMLTLYLEDGQLKLSNFTSDLNSIYEAYEIMCRIMNINSSEYDLKVVKIESGSLLGKLIGSDPVIEALAYIIKKIADLVFNKFTYEGKLLRVKEILDVMKVDAELIGKYKELGVDINFNLEDVEKNHFLLTKSVQQMIVKNTKIKVNDYEISLESNIKQKYLDDSKKLLVEESKNRES